MEDGAEISDVYGRALYSQDGGKSEINGVISRITPVGKPNFQAYNLGTEGRGFGGIAVYEDSSSEVTLGASGRICDITASKSADVVLFIKGTSKFTMENGSKISDITLGGIAECDGNNTIKIDGKISNCSLENVAIRIRGNNNTFELLEHGIITECDTTDVGAIYTNSLREKLTISGEISYITQPALFIAANRGQERITCRFAP